MTITELADKIIKDGHWVIGVLLRTGNIDEAVIDTLDTIIYTAHNIKEHTNEGSEGQSGQRIEERTTEEEHDPGYHVL